MVSDGVNSRLMDDLPLLGTKMVEYISSTMILDDCSTHYPVSHPPMEFLKLY